jgi:catechol 2,3-dioxygenase-like lactoylglutathione lyase family enzyme
MKAWLPAKETAMPLKNCTPVTFLFTRDREKAKLWYRDTLGLVHTASDEFAECFNLGGVPLRIVPIPDHTPSPHTVLGWNVLDIEATVRALAEKGVKCEVYEGFGQDELGIWSAPDGHAKIAWFLDPEGNNLSVTQF